MEKMRMRREVLICLLLAGITLGLYWPLSHLGFFDCDDPEYILTNPQVREGISPDNVWWAFANYHAGNWHPLTWLSLMLDCQLFGPNPRLLHLENVAWHTANALLLFLLLRKMTRLREEATAPSTLNLQPSTAPRKALWRSAFVAALFAWHPMHLQSVAWIVERKDVPSGFFMLLTLWAYAEYAESGGRRTEVRGQRSEDRGQRSEGRGQRSEVRGQRSEVRSLWSLVLGPWSGAWCFGASLVFYALGLMSKPMLVTLPVILLLLDFWPLGRFDMATKRRVGARGLQEEDCAPVGRVPSRGGSESPSDLRPPTSDLRPLSSGLRPLLLEKIPFAVLSLFSILATCWAQAAAISKISSDKLPLLERMGNAPVFVVCYLEKLFWPVNLGIYYPYWRIPIWEQAGCGLLVALLTMFCLWRLRSNPQPSTFNPQPSLLTGWLWFLIMLLPVIGLVQVGGQSIADRYTYLPSIGLFIAVVWGLTELASHDLPGVCSSRREEALTSRISNGASSRRLLQVDEPSNARRSGPSTLNPQPSTPPQRLRRVTLAALGVACLLACLMDTRWQMKYWRNNVTLYQHAVEAAPKNNSTSYCGLGNNQWIAGDLEGAASSFQAALQAETDYPWQKRDELCHHVLGIVLLRQNKPVEAEAEFEATLRAKTTPALTAYSHKYLGDALATEGKTVEAENEYTRAEQLLPKNPALRLQLAASRTLAGLRETLKTGATPDIYAQMAGIEASVQLDRNALEHYLAALKLKPDAPEILNNLAWLLATSHDSKVRAGNRAVQYARHACELTEYRTTAFLGTLAAAYAEAGKFDDASATAQKACDRAAKDGDAAGCKRTRSC